MSNADFGAVTSTAAGIVKPPDDYFVTSTVRDETTGQPVVIYTCELCYALTASPFYHTRWHFPNGSRADS